MGNRSSTAFEVCKPSEPGEWVKKGTTGYSDIIANVRTGVVAEQYTVPVDRRLSAQEDLLTYEFRRTQNDGLVRVYQVERENSSIMCQGEQYQKVKTEYIAKRLCDCEGLTEAQGLYVLREALASYRTIVRHNKRGVFNITAEMIGFTPDGKVRVWLNDNFGKNLPDPEQYARAPAHNPNAYVPENDTVWIDKIYDLVESHIQTQKYPIKFRQMYTQHPPSTFDEAIDLVNAYSTNFRQAVANCVNLSRYPAQIAHNAQVVTGVGVPVGQVGHSQVNLLGTSKVGTLVQAPVVGQSAVHRLGRAVSQSHLRTLPVASTNTTSSILYGAVPQRNSRIISQGVPIQIVQPVNNSRVILRNSIAGSRPLTAVQLNGSVSTRNISSYPSSLFGVPQNNNLTLTQCRQSEWRPQTLATNTIRQSQTKGSMSSVILSTTPSAISSSIRQTTGSQLFAPVQRATVSQTPQNISSSFNTTSIQGPSTAKSVSQSIQGGIQFSNKGFRKTAGQTNNSSLHFSKPSDLKRPDITSTQVQNQTISKFLSKPQVQTVTQPQVIKSEISAVTQVNNVATVQTKTAQSRPNVISFLGNKDVIRAPAQTTEGNVIRTAEKNVRVVDATSKEQQDTPMFKQQQQQKQQQVITATTTTVQGEGHQVVEGQIREIPIQRISEGGTVVTKRQQVAKGDRVERPPAVINQQVQYVRQQPPSSQQQAGQNRQVITQVPQQANQANTQAAPKAGYFFKHRQPATTTVQHPQPSQPAAEVLVYTNQTTVPAEQATVEYTQIVQENIETIDGVQVREVQQHIIYREGGQQQQYQERYEREEIQYEEDGQMQEIVTEQVVETVVQRGQDGEIRTTQIVQESVHIDGRDEDYIEITQTTQYEREPARYITAQSSHTPAVQYERYVNNGGNSSNQYVISNQAGGSDGRYIASGNSYYATSGQSSAGNAGVYGYNQYGDSEGPTILPSKKYEELKARLQ